MRRSGAPLPSRGMRAGSYYYPPRTDDVTDGRICFKADGLDMNVSTRTSEVTTANLTSFNFVVHKYEYDGEDWYFSEECGPYVATKSGNVYTTSLYWPATYGTDVKYKFTATNIPEEYLNLYGDEETYLDGTLGNDTDWVWCTTDYIASAGTVSLTFNHWLSRIGTVAVNAPSGYTITVNSMSIEWITSIEFMNEGSLSGFPSILDDDDCYFYPSGSIQSLSVGANDVWIWGAPGNQVSSTPTYPVTTMDFTQLPDYYDDDDGTSTWATEKPVFRISYTLTKGDFTKTYSKYAFIDIQAGKTHNLTINITTDEAQGIQLNSTVTAWAAQATSLTIN